MLILEVEQLDPRFKRGTFISVTGGNHLEAMVLVNGIELTVHLKNLIPLPNGPDSSLKRIETEAKNPVSLWFCGHRYGWIAEEWPPQTPGSPVITL